MKIGRFEILELIGQGAMGTVYKALDPLIERTVAIKTIPISRLKEESKEFEERFLREAQSAGRLSHPNIVTIYDVGETDDLAYIAMEYLRGTTLRDIMDRGPMPLDLVMTTALQIAEALAYAHEHGVVHRDIKPSNIVITLPRGQIKLTDFGIAHLVNSEKTNAGLMLGSPRYMSPEQAMGQTINGRSDIFSLGAVLYEMITGVYAFAGESLPNILYQVINEIPVSPVGLMPEITSSFDRIIMRMLNKEAKSRLDASTLILELHKAGKYGSPLVNHAITANGVPRIFPIIAFTTPFAVLMLTAVGMIVINYFLTLSPKLPSAARANLPLISSSNNAILDWANPPQSDTGVTLQKIEPHSQPNVPSMLSSFKPKNIKLGNSSKPPSPDAYLQSLERKKIELEIKKTDLLLKYTEQHPDVILISRQLKQLETERKIYLRKQKKNHSH